MQKTFWVSSKLTQQSKTCLYVQRTCILETKTQIINCSVLQVIDGVPCKHVIRYANFGNGSCVLTKFYTKWFIEDDFLVCENATRSLVLCVKNNLYGTTKIMTPTYIHKSCNDMDITGDKLQNITS